MPGSRPGDALQALERPLDLPASGHPADQWHLLPRIGYWLVIRGIHFQSSQRTPRGASEYSQMLRFL